MQKTSLIVLSILCFINFILALVILRKVIVLKNASPILQMASFSQTEIESLSNRMIASINCFTILCNTCLILVIIGCLSTRALLQEKNEHFGCL